MSSRQLETETEYDFAAIDFSIQRADTETVMQQHAKMAGFGAYPKCPLFVLHTSQEGSL